MVRRIIHHTRGRLEAIVLMDDVMRSDTTAMDQEAERQDVRATREGIIT